MKRQIRNSMSKLMLAGVAGLALAACDNGSEGAVALAPQPAVEADYALEESLGGASRAKSALRSPSPDQSPEPGAEAGAMLAYSYSMGVTAPKGAVAGLKDAHEQACKSAGPKVCQVLNASVNSWGEDQVSASLNLRAAPDWLETFRGSIASDAEKSGGRITSNNVNAEDLTAYIVDLDARLSAKRALRDRIRQLLDSREGSLSDILAAERALADVQGEIDSMTARLAAARARVDMSALSISYNSDPTTSTGVFKPLADAFKGFFRTSIASLAAAVDFVARAWPFFLIGLAVLFILRGWWRGRRSKA